MRSRSLAAILTAAIALVAATPPPASAQSLTIEPVTDTALRLNAQYRTASGNKTIYRRDVVWRVRDPAILSVAPVPGVSWDRHVYVQPASSGCTWVDAQLTRATAPRLLVASAYVCARATLVAALSTPSAPPPAPPPVDTTTPPPPVDTTSPPPVPPPSAGVAELPRDSVDVRSPVTLRTLRVLGSLQAALDSARGGDLILVPASYQRTETIVLPARPASDSTYAVVRGEIALPPPGTVPDTSALAGWPTIATTAATRIVTTAPGAHHWRVEAIRFHCNNATTGNAACIHFRLGTSGQTASEIPHHIVLDRLALTACPTCQVHRGVELNGAHQAVISSVVTGRGKGYDTQAIEGWNGPGPFLIEGNVLEGAGENIMFGGVNPSIQGMIPSDIIVRRNRIVKPAAWKGVWTVKNLFELKCAQRVLVEGNLMEGSWVDGQVGFAWNLKTANPGTAPWCVTQDVTMRRNRVRLASNGVSVKADPSGTGGVPARRIVIEGNLFEEINVAPGTGAGRLIELGGALTDLVIAHNTFTHGANGGSTCMVLAGTAQSTRTVFRDNVCTRGGYGVKADATPEGTASVTKYFGTTGTFTGNAIVGAPAAMYPPGNLFPSSLGGVPAGVGADLAALRAAIAGVP